MSTHLAKDGTQVSLRRLSADDVMILFEWQCHPGTRRFARNPQPPKLEAYKKWFATRLTSKDCILTMILHDGQPAGMLRFDQTPDAFSEAWEASILIGAGQEAFGHWCCGSCFGSGVDAIGGAGRGGTA